MGLSRFLSLVGLSQVEWQADLEAGGSGLRFDGDEAGVLVDDPLDGVQAKTETASGSFGCKERLEDAGAILGSIPGPSSVTSTSAMEPLSFVVSRRVPRSFMLSRAFSIRGGPDLVEFAAIRRLTGGKVGVEVQFNPDVLEARVEHDERVFE